MWFCVISRFQFFISCLRNSWLNGPAYDRNPVASRTSPTSRLICASKPLLAAVQRIFSPDSPSISAVAMFILRRQAFASSTSACTGNQPLMLLCCRRLQFNQTICCAGRVNESVRCPSVSPVFFLASAVGRVKRRLLKLSRQWTVRAAASVLQVRCGPRYEGRQRLFCAFSKEAPFDCWCGSS